MNLVPGLKRLEKNSQLSSLKKGFIVCSTNSSSNSKLEHLGRRNSGVPVIRFNDVEPFRGKSGSVSFYGLTHQSVEEGKLVSAPFNEDKGSFLWVLAPVTLISSLILPQFFFTSAIEAVLGDETLVGNCLSVLSLVSLIAFGCFGGLKSNGLYVINSPVF